MKIPEISKTLSETELWRQTAKALDNGDFSWLDKLLTSQNASVFDLLEANNTQQKYRDEALAWACFTGRNDEVAKLLDSGVDPAAGIATGLAAFHWAANRGNLETIKLLIKRNAPLEQKNMYGGTVLGCALYSAVYEHRDTHADIIEELIKAGAVIEEGSLEWWKEQDVPSAETKRRVAEVLRGSENRKDDRASP